MSVLTPPDNTRIGESAANAAEELRLKVTGMHCASCAATVQRALEAEPGVRSASVSVTDEAATITGSGLESARLIQAIEAKGYAAKPMDEAPAAAELRSEIEDRQQRNERRWRFRAIVGLSIWAPLEILHWTAPHPWHTWMPWVMLIGSTIVMLVAGGGFYKSAWRAATKRTTNMDTLIAIGATTAYVFSLVVFIAQQFYEALLDQQLYFAEAAALLGIISLGHWLEARSSARAGSAVRELLELQPDEAELLETPKRRNAKTSKEEDIAGTSGGRMISSADVREGDVLLIRPGGRVPVDGEVIEGRSDVDESVVTGESEPAARGPGDSVVAGSMNTTGRLVIRATVDGRHTTISRIADMVQRAQSSKAEIQRLADRVSSIFVPAVLTIALVTFIGWWIAGDFPTGVIATVTVLIISCPCALGLATPMAVMVGAGAASKRGILVKSAAALETAGNATTVIFDKTGTLTAGKPAVTAIEVVGSDDETNALRFAAAVEMPSEHPIARAIVSAAREREIDVPEVEDFAAIPGEGVRGIVEGRNITIIRDERTTCRVEVDGETIARITVQDDVRDDARAAVQELRALGMRVIMLTGDTRSVAERIGGELGFTPDEIVSEATPESKTQFVASMTQNGEIHRGGRGVREDETGTGLHEKNNISSLRASAPPAVHSSSSSSGGVIMVGDGINDAAALARADLGIAMASGTNIAIESADVVIPGDRVIAVAETVELSRQTLQTIKQNLFFAFFYNAAAIPAAAFGLLGPYGPLIAAAAMGFSDVTVIGNALRLKRKLR